MVTAMTVLADTPPQPTPGAPNPYSHNDFRVRNLVRHLGSTSLGAPMPRIEPADQLLDEWLDGSLRLVCSIT
jgi:hypothetical protein